jgi:polyphosphate kinase
MSENIRIRRIVDRYLEHGRLFYFYNSGNEEFYAGSADWMNRNIYRRIEVCFPVNDELIRSELKKMLALQLRDNVQAVDIGPNLENLPVTDKEENIRSQESIYQMIRDND